jgi:hypothetical protein
VIFLLLAGFSPTDRAANRIPGAESDEHQRGESTSIRTHLRAMAGTVEIEQAQIPTSGPGESDVYDWLTTVQVGGDVVYGKQGPVERGTRVLGESTYDGVFVRTLASADGRCRGSVYGNDWPQA